MPDLNADQAARLGQLLDLPPEQWQQLMAGTQQLSDADLQALAGSTGQQTAPPDDTEAFAAWFESLSDAEIAAMEAGMEGQTATAAAGAGLSYEAMEAIELAGAQSADALAQLRQVTAELDGQRFQVERRRLYDMGVPQPVIDIFQPLLEGAGHVVELSNGTSVDAGQIVRNGIAEFARMARMLDLDPVELGSPVDEPDGASAQQAESEREALVSRARQMMGI